MKYYIKEILLKLAAFNLNNASKVILLAGMAKHKYNFEGKIFRYITAKLLDYFILSGRIYRYIDPVGIEQDAYNMLGWSDIGDTKADFLKTQQRYVKGGCEVQTGCFRRSDCSEAAEGQENV